MSAVGGLEDVRGPEAVSCNERLVQVVPIEDPLLKMQRKGTSIVRDKRSET